MRPFRREKSVTFDYSPVESSRDSLTPSRAEVDDDDWRSSYREERLKDLRFPSLPLSLSFSLLTLTIVKAIEIIDRYVDIFVFWYLTIFEPTDEIAAMNEYFSHDTIIFFIEFDIRRE